MNRIFAILALPLALGLGACTEDRVVLDEDPASHGGSKGETVDRVGQSCEVPLAEAECGERGVQFCSLVADDYEWGPCLEEVECGLGETRDCENFGTETCEVFGGVPAWDDSGCFDDQGGETPLVLKFSDQRVEYSAAASATFDISGRGTCVSTDWPTAATPWLAIDLDRNGVVDSGRELFGSGSVLADGTLASNGFEALALLDTNADGWITADDGRFNELVAWADEDGDRVGTLDELTPVSAFGLTAIQLSYHRDALCDGRGNCEVERAAFSFDGGRTGEVVDVHLSCQ